MMARIFAALIALALCVGVFGAAYAQVPVLVTKSAKWAVWGPNGIVGTPTDTAAFSGAMVDTTGPIYIGDMSLSNIAGGTVSTTENNILKVTVVAQGIADNVDSVYYRIEHSPNGVNWVSVLAANTLNNMVGAIAGIDQGNAAAGTTVNNAVSFFITQDPDQVSDGASGTAAIFQNAWWLSPYIRIFFRTLASDTFLGARLYVSYPGIRENP